MPLPLLPLALGTLIGVKGPALYRKVRDFLTPKGTGPVVVLDSTLPDAMRRDVLNVLQNVQSGPLLEKMSAYYRAMGFPTAADAIAAKLHSLQKG